MVQYIQYSTVQYSTVWYSTVLYSKVRYVTVQYSTVWYSTVLYSTVQYQIVNTRQIDRQYQIETVQYCMLQYGMIQYSVVHYTIVQYCTVRLPLAVFYGRWRRRCYNWRWSSSQPAQCTTIIVLFSVVQNSKVSYIIVQYSMYGIVQYSKVTFGRLLWEMEEEVLELAMVFQPTCTVYNYYSTIQCSVLPKGIFRILTFKNGKKDKILTKF